MATRFVVVSSIRLWDCGASSGGFRVIRSPRPQTAAQVPDVVVSLALREPLQPHPRRQPRRRPPLHLASRSLAVLLVPAVEVAVAEVVVGAEGAALHRVYRRAFIAPRSKKSWALRSRQLGR